MEYLLKPLHLKKKIYLITTTNNKSIITKLFN